MLLSLFKNTYHCILLTLRYLAATITSTELQGPSNMMLYNLKIVSEKTSAKCSPRLREEQDKIS